MIKNMKKLLIITLACIAFSASGQTNYFKFSTFYVAANGGTSVSDVDVYSVANGLETSTIRTPYDYNLSMKIHGLTELVLVKYLV